MLILFGATGMVGAEVLHLALADPRVPRVVSIGRRPTGVTHPKLLELIHKDFLDLTLLDPHLAAATSCVHCLGVYQNQVPEDEFWRITYGYIDALVTAFERLNPGVRFVLMGAQGADPTERRRILFAKAKGRAERRITESTLQHRFILRPGYIDPGRVPTRASAPTWLVRPIYWVLPFLGVGAVDLARVLLEKAITGSGSQLLTNADIRVAAKSLRLESGGSRAT
jgi:uncharacterized protein YbjT (DUF2867 family)